MCSAAALQSITGLLTLPDLMRAQCHCIIMSLDARSHFILVAVGVLEDSDILVKVMQIASVTPLRHI